MFKNQGLFLITSDIEKKWKFDRPVVFLGEWCKVYSKKELWLRTNSITAEPYKPDYNNIDTEIEQVDKYRNVILGELVQALNRFHHTTHSVNYWNLVLGHWLYRFICVIYNRYYTLKQCFDLYKITGANFTFSNGFYLVPKDTFDFINSASNDHEWNDILYTKIIQFWNINNIEKFEYQAQKVNFNDDKTTTFYIKLKRVFLDFIKKSLLPLFARESDAVISSTYLPLSKEFALNFLFFQCPQFWVSPELKQREPDLHLRKKFYQNFKSHEYKGLDSFLRICLAEMIPVCYLEGYTSLIDEVNKLNWPVKPKFIFTSNRFDFDEIFKVWSANKIEKGFNYYVGQHGNNYGTLKGIQHTPEQIDVTKFLTWGWTNGQQKIIPVYNFKLVGKKLRLKFNQKNILIISAPPPLRLKIIDETFYYNASLKSQFEFYNILSNESKEDTIIRLHSLSRNSKCEEEKRWEYHFPEIKFDRSGKSIFNIIGHCKLVVHTYDSTGILETLALNIPTICFWNGENNHLIPPAKIYYNLLIDAGILYFSATDAANAINTLSKDLIAWWQSEKVQYARIKFCSNYSKINKAPLITLKNILSES